MMKIHSDLRNRLEAASVLIIEDDLHLQELIRHSVTKIGCQVVVCQSGIEALHLLSTYRIDLVLMEILLPDVNGIQLCKAIRGKTNAPIIAVSSLIHEQNIVDILSSGADEFIPKPFRFEILEAFVMAQLRRAILWSSYSWKGQMTRNSRLTIDNNRKLWIGDRSISLTRKESDTLCYLMSTPGVPVSTTAIGEQVWGKQGERAKNSVRNIVKQLRDKIESDPLNPSIIVNARGFGYVFEPCI